MTQAATAPAEGTTWLNKKEVANYLSVKVRTIDYLVKRGKLPTPYAFSKRMKRWDLKEIENHIRNIRLKEEIGISKETEHANGDDDEGQRQRV